MNLRKRHRGASAEVHTSAMNDIDGSMRTSAQKYLERSYGFVARYVIALDPAHAVLRIDDVESSRKNGERLLLPVGHHTVEARAPAYLPEKRGLDVRGGEARLLGEPETEPRRGDPGG